MSPNTLPEGTDAIIDDMDTVSDIDTSGAIPMDAGAEADAQAALDSITDTDAPAPTLGEAKQAAGESLRDAQDKVGAKAQDLKGQATDKLRAYATSGKDRATESLSGFAKLIEDSAATVDDKIGAQYGDYARQAAQTISGFAADLENKDVDELFDQARDVVRKSPGIAIGAASAIGFVLARIVKAGIDAGAAAPTPGKQEPENDVDFSPDPTLGR